MQDFSFGISKDAISSQTGDTIVYGFGSLNTRPYIGTSREKFSFIKDAWNWGITGVENVWNWAMYDNVGIASKELWSERGGPFGWAAWAIKDVAVWGGRDITYNLFWKRFACAGESGDYSDAECAGWVDVGEFIVREGEELGNHIKNLAIAAWAWSEDNPIAATILTAGMYTPVHFARVMTNDFTTTDDYGDRFLNMFSQTELRELGYEILQVSTLGPVGVIAMQESGLKNQNDVTIFSGEWHVDNIRHFASNPADFLASIFVDSLLYERFRING